MRRAHSSEIYWLIQSLADVPAGDSWLGSNEALLAAKLRFEKRRNDWRLGRWTAKRAILSFLELHTNDDRLSRTEILAAADGAPEAFLDGTPCPISMSISHSGGAALCSVACAGAALGCDLELIQERPGGFAADYFTAQEIGFLECAPKTELSAYVNLVWSSKESVLKALRQGLRRDTRSVQVQLPSARQKGWNLLSAVDQDSSRIFRVWWRIHGRYIQTIASELSVGPPQSLV